MADVQRRRLRARVTVTLEGLFGEESAAVVVAALSHASRGESEGMVRVLNVEDVEVLGESPQASSQNVDDGPFFDATTIAALAAEQNVAKVADFDLLLGDFWPKDETPDQLLTTLREWRGERA